MAHILLVNDEVDLVEISRRFERWGIK